MKTDPSLIAICVSEKKGTRKTPVNSACFIANHGIQGDAHAGSGHRQVSLLASEDIEAMRARGLPDLTAGAFAENLIVTGVPLGELGLGSRIRLGNEAELEISQRGKVCHTRCAIYDQVGDCVMPRLGLFARVVKGGVVSVGDSVAIAEIIPKDVFQCAVLTISDRCFRGEAQDSAGPAVVARLRDTVRVHIYETRILPDEQKEIEAALRCFSDEHSMDLVLTVGGTGFAPRDVTPEAVRAVVERLTPGLDEAMRAASLRKTTRAMLSRAVSGIRGKTLIISLPGSERAAVENLDALLPAIEHGLAKLRGDPSDCGRTAPNVEKG